MILEKAGLAVKPCTLRETRRMLRPITGCPEEWEELDLLIVADKNANVNLVYLSLGRL